MRSSFLPKLRQAGLFRQAGYRSQKRLRDFLPADELTEVPENASLIIRTNAGELTEKEPLVSDIQSFLRWPASFCQLPTNVPATAVCTVLPVPYLMEIRDTYTDQFDAIITDDRQLYEETADFPETQYPEELSRLQFYEDPRVSLSNLYACLQSLRRPQKRVYGSNPAAISS